MRAFRTLIAFAFLAAVIATMSADLHAQVRRGMVVRNPMTGGVAYRGAAYNPITGVGGVNRGYHNPYTGTNVNSAVRVNPYTGNAMAAKTVYNPYTGAGAVRVIKN